MENLDICSPWCDNNEVKRISLWACSAVGSAPHSHCGGRRFESDQVHETREIRTCFRLEKGSDFSFSSESKMPRAELDCLIYNDPLGYADLILNGAPEKYLRNVTGSHGSEI